MKLHPLLALGLALGFLAGVLSGCSRAAPVAARAEVAPPEPPRVTADRTDLAFRYRTASGYATATSIAEVPEEARSQVIVYDPARDEAGWFFVADLREADSAGTYPVKALRSVDLEKSSGEGAPAAVAQPRVRLYSASWCGVCRKARAWLKAHKVPFVEKDVEKDRSAQGEIAAAARKAHIPQSQLNGVPIIVVGDKMMTGFDPQRLKRWLR